MQLKTRLVDRLLWILCGLSAVSGVVLLIVFMRFGALQQEFLSLNFDAVHSTRALLRAEVLVTRALGDLRSADQGSDAERVTRAADNLEAALVYERNGQYPRSEVEVAAVQRAHGLLLDMRAAAQRGAVAPDEIRLFTRRLRELAQRFADADGDRWGALFSLNEQLRNRMDANRLYGYGAGFLLLVLTAVMSWGVVRKRRLDTLLADEKRQLEKEVDQRRRTEVALRDSEMALFAEKERAQVTLASIGEAVVTSSRDGTIEYLNPVAESLCEWPLSEARGKPLAQVLVLCDENTGERLLDPARLLRDGGARIVARAALLTNRRGESLAVELTAAQITDRDQAVAGLVVVLRDVRDARILQHELAWQATHDALTGLYNRREFEQRLDQLLAKRETTRMHAMLYLDLDQFKVVNDTSGHAAGDQLLQAICPQLQAQLRAEDSLARLGGDEFGVLLVGCDPVTAMDIANRLRLAVENFRFAWDGKEFVIGVSIGLIHFSASGLTARDVMSRTDAACYMAKDLGRNRIQVYRQDDDEMSRRHDEMEWVSRIRRALADRRFVLFRQPIVALRGDRARSRRHEEILLRMRDEAGELVPPMMFIPAAERYGLMIDIDCWVIAETLRLCALQPPQRDAPTIAINLSGASLASEKLVAHVCECLERTGVNARRICFEITETAAVTHLERAARLMQSLRLMGCRFALDDFGAGMSSFSYLRRLPVDFLKIDGAFVRGLDKDPVNQAMVRSINEVGHILGLKTIAEFVETAEELEMLKSLGVDYVQGYHLGRPEPWKVLA